MRRYDYFSLFEGMVHRSNNPAAPQNSGPIWSRIPFFVLRLPPHSRSIGPGAFLPVAVFFFLALFAHCHLAIIGAEDPFPIGRGKLFMADRTTTLNDHRYKPSKIPRMMMSRIVVAVRPRTSAGIDYTHIVSGPDPTVRATL